MPSGAEALRAVVVPSDDYPRNAPVIGSGRAYSPATVLLLALFFFRKKKGTRLLKCADGLARRSYCGMICLDQFLACCAGKTTAKGYYLETR